MKVASQVRSPTGFQSKLPELLTSRLYSDNPFGDLLLEPAFRSPVTL
jgi:hypothetical protein